MDNIRGDYDLEDMERACLDADRWRERAEKAEDQLRMQVEYLTAELEHALERAVDAEATLAAVRDWADNNEGTQGLKKILDGEE